MELKAHTLLHNGTRSLELAAIFHIISVYMFLEEMQLETLAIPYMLTLGIILGPTIEFLVGVTSSIRNTFLVMYLIFREHCEYQVRDEIVMCNIVILVLYILGFFFYISYLLLLCYERKKSVKPLTYTKVV